MPTTDAASATAQIVEPKTTSPEAQPSPDDAPAHAEALPRRRDDLPRLLTLPMNVSWKKVRWKTTFVIAGMHTLALLAISPWLFSWSGLALAIFGVYIFGGLGINVCYHRLLTHRSFKTPRWFEKFLTMIACCNLEGSPISWVANHRMHHQHSDDEPDPHSPVVAFLWSHVGWLLVENRNVNDEKVLSRYARDLYKDPFYARLEKGQRWLVVWAAHVALLFGAGFGVGMLSAGTADAGLQMGLSWIVWGVFMRTILVWHITWSVNSLTHMLGYRNYETEEGSRNNWLVAIFAFGEGWHNNHHADQNAAAHGHRWWEVDLTYSTILLFKKLGLAWNIVPPRKSWDGRAGHHHHH
ncbi:MAG: fatty acid desaturase [Planctomycetota bacterium]|nr:fatty acid desaturase [Planctomycetota bacterium]